MQCASKDSPWLVCKECAAVGKCQLEAAPLPAEPPPGLLNSMALRYRHDFGLLSTEVQDSILRDMRRLYEEVSGHGFYRWP